MQIITVINQKGGVGKSTTVLAIGEGLILQGYKVLYVDLDAQGNLSYVMRADANRTNAMHVLQQPETVNEAIQITHQGHIIASTPLLATADNIITGQAQEYQLAKAFKCIKGNYDYIIIDTPPALGILTTNALTACTGAIIPAQADIFSLQGISQLYATIEAVREYSNSDLQILGILLTRYNARTIISRDVAEALEQVAERLHTKLYDARIRECTAIKEAQATKQSIYAYAPKSNAVIDYSQLVEEIIND